MSKDLIADILKVLVLSTGVAAYFIKDASKRRMAVIALLVACTALVGYSFYGQYSIKDRDSKGLSIMDSSTAEFMMKLASSIEDVFREAGSTGIGSVMGGADSKTNKMMDEMHQAAIKSARLAFEHDPTSVAMRFRALVMAGESRISLQKELGELKAMSDKNAAPAALLIEEFYEKHTMPKADVASALALSDTLTSKGWVRDVTTIKIYRTAGEQARATKLLDEYHNGLVLYAYRIICLMIAAICLGFTGTLVLLSQFFFWPRQLTSDQERSLIAAPQAYGFLKIYGVFVGWLAFECICSPLMSDVAKFVKKPTGAPDPLTVALIVFIIYTLTNGPALIIAWLVAIKPTGVRFVDAVKLRLRVTRTGPTGTTITGPVRLVFTGISAWLCAIPLIMVSAVISKSMQSHGSANPILPIISEVVRSGGVVTILLFVFVLGVMPALCEETLFRGFLYTSLRVKHNVFYSVMVSATAFAAVHLDPGAFLQLFILGAVFALVMERSKSLVPAMVAHCLWNSGTLILMMVAFGG